MFRALFSRLVVAILPLLSGLFYFATGAAAEESRPNIILISLDTLRADRVGVLGYSRPTSPFIDSVAAKGRVFTSAVSVSCWTLPSHVSMLSGLLPSSHGVVQHDRNKIGKSTALLQEILGKNGYHTMALTSGGYVGRFFGFNRGFNTFETRRRDAKRETTPSRIWKRAAALALEAPKDKPVFFFLHTFDIHCPYAPPEPYFSMFKSKDAKEIEPGHCGAFYNQRVMTPAEALYLSDRYDGALRWTDDGLKFFFEAVKDRFNLGNTVFILVSDHGEEFLDHGRIGHQRSLYWELLHVPLIFAGPGIVPGRVSAGVSLVDIVPSVLELSGVKYQFKYQLAGQSLLAILRGEEQKLGGPQVAELDRDILLRSSVNGGAHYIRYPDQAEDRLFSLTKDVREQENLAPSTEAKSARTALEKIIEALPRVGAGKAPPLPDEGGAPVEKDAD